MPYQNSHELDPLIRKAGESTGIDPQEIRRAVDAGKLDALLGKLRPQDAARFAQIVNDPKLAEQMLASPQAKRLIAQFLK